MAMQNNWLTAEMLKDVVKVMRSESVPSGEMTQLLARWEEQQWRERKIKEQQSQLALLGPLSVTKGGGLCSTVDLEVGEKARVGIKEMILQRKRGSMSGGPLVLPRGMLGEEIACMADLDTLYWKACAEVQRMLKPKARGLITQSDYGMRKHKLVAAMPRRVDNALCGFDVDGYEPLEKARRHVAPPARALRVAPVLAWGAR